MAVPISHGFGSTKHPDSCIARNFAVARVFARVISVGIISTRARTRQNSDQTTRNIASFDGGEAFPQKHQQRLIHRFHRFTQMSAKIGLRESVDKDSIRSASLLSTS